MHEEIIMLVILACVPDVSLFLVEMKFYSSVVHTLLSFLVSLLTQPSRTLFAGRCLESRRSMKSILIQVFSDRIRREAKRGLDHHR